MGSSRICPRKKKTLPPVSGGNAYRLIRHLVFYPEDKNGTLLKAGLLTYPPSRGLPIGTFRKWPDPGGRPDRPVGITAAGTVPEFPGPFREHRYSLLSPLGDHQQGKGRKKNQDVGLRTQDTGRKTQGIRSRPQFGLRKFAVWDYPKSGPLPGGPSAGSHGPYRTGIFSRLLFTTERRSLRDQSGAAKRLNKLNTQHRKPNTGLPLRQGAMDVGIACLEGGDEGRNQPDQCSCSQQKAFLRP